MKVLLLLKYYGLLLSIPLKVLLLFVTVVGMTVVVVLAGTIGKLGSKRTARLVYNITTVA